MRRNNSFSNGPVQKNIVSFRMCELRKMLETENSCVSCITCTRSIDIMPMHLTDLNSSMKELLNDKVTKFDVGLQGIILAHKHVKIVATSVQLSDNRTFPLEYIADIYLFKPEKGCTLTGVVNKINYGSDSFSILVHNLFNVAVYCDQGQRPTMNIGSVVNVTVVQLDFTGRLPYIKANYSSCEALELSQVDLPVHQQKTNKQHKDLSMSTSVNSILKQSHLDSYIQLDSPKEEPAETTILNGTTDDNRHIKKKKKKDKINESSDEVSSSKKRKRTSDNSDKAEKSPKKKPKEGEITNSLNSTVIAPINDSIYKVASSTPIGPQSPNVSPTKHLKQDSKKSKKQDLSIFDETMLILKQEMEQSIGKINEAPFKSPKPPKIKKSITTNGIDQNSSSTQFNSSVDSLNQTVTNKKKKKHKKEKSNMDDLQARLLSEALQGLKTET